MKFTVTKKKTKQGSSAPSDSANPPSSRSSDGFLVDIPDTVVARPPTHGELFDVTIERQGHKKTVKAAFLGDGDSLLIGTRVVRIPANFHAGKKGSYRFQLGEVSTPQTLILKPVRPVEPKKSAGSLGGGPLKSPMTGKVLAVNVSDGASVKEGDVLLTIEAMKMENRIVAECDGTVKALHAKPGMAVTTGEILLTVEPTPT